MVTRGKFLGIAASAMGVSAISIAIAFLRQLLIAAYYGTSRDLDIFLIVYAMATWFVLNVGIGFDAIAVPRLVRLREASGGEASQALAAAVFRLSIGLALVAGIFLVAVTPLLAPIIATGFTPEERARLADLAWYFLPYICVYLPYYAAGARYKGEWRFKRVFIAEIIVGIAGALFLVLAHDSIRRLPFAYAAGYVAGLLWLLPGSGLLGRSPPAAQMRGAMHNLGELYVTSQAANLPGFVDRHYQSLVPAGGIAAISYAGQLVTGILTLLSMREVFVVPLSESRSRDERLERLMIGLLLLSMPVAGLIGCFAPEIVQVLFQHGRFDAAAAAVTGTVLRLYCPIIVTGVVTRPLIRMFQIAGRIGFTYFHYLALALCYAGFGALFIGRLDLGVHGIICIYLASAMPSAMLLVFLVRRCGIVLRWRRIAGYGLYSAMATVAAVVGGLAAASPFHGVWWRLLAGGPSYAAIVAAFVVVAWTRLRHALG